MGAPVERAETPRRRVLPGPIEDGEGLVDEALAVLERASRTALDVLLLSGEHPGRPTGEEVLVRAEYLDANGVGVLEVCHHEYRVHPGRGGSPIAFRGDGFAVAQLREGGPSPARAPRDPARPFVANDDLRAVEALLGSHPAEVRSVAAAVAALPGGDGGERAGVTGFLSLSVEESTRAEAVLALAIVADVVAGAPAEWAVRRLLR